MKQVCKANGLGLRRLVTAAGGVMLLLGLNPSTVGAQTGVAECSAGEARRIASTGDPARAVECLEAWLRRYRVDPGSASRMERRSQERSAAKRLLEIDSTHVLGLEVAARWALDEVEWNVVPLSRFQTGYFQRKVDEGAEQTERLLARLQALVPQGEASYRLSAHLYAFIQDWESLRRAALTTIRFRPEYPEGYLYRGLAEHMLFEDVDAANSFAMALDRMSPSQRAGFEDPVRFLAGSETQAEAFWQSRDPRLLTPENERRTEHYARLVLAELYFGGRDAPGAQTIEGDLLVRYGLPLDAMSAVSPYGRVVSSILEGGGGMKTWDYGDFRLVVEDPWRNGTFRFFSPSARSQTNAGPGGVADYEIEARVRFRDEPERYDHQVPGRRVDIPFSATVLKGSGGEADVMVGFGLPVDEVETAGGRLPIEADFGFFVVGPRGPVRSLLLPLRGLPADRLVQVGADHLWTGHAELKAPAGSWALSVEFETTDGSTIGYQRDSLRVPLFRPDSLSMSDLLLAYLVEESEPGRSSGRLERGGLSILPSPWGVFETGQPLYLYFESYGLLPGLDGARQYTVEAVLERIDDSSTAGRVLGFLFGGGGRDAVSASYEATSQGPDDGQYLILDASGEEAGAYRVNLRITDRVAQRTVSSSRSVWLVDPEP